MPWEGGSQRTPREDKVGSARRTQPVSSADQEDALSTVKTKLLNNPRVPGCTNGGVGQRPSPRDDAHGGRGGEWVDLRRKNFSLLHLTLSTVDMTHVSRTPYSATLTLYHEWHCTMCSSLYCN